MIVYNKNTDRYEKAKKIQCPRCKGFGQICKEDHPCSLCNGKMSIWISTTGSSWTRQINQRKEYSRLY